MKCCRPPSFWQWLSAGTCFLGKIRLFSGSKINFTRWNRVLLREWSISGLTSSRVGIAPRVRTSLDILRLVSDPLELWWSRWKVENLEKLDLNGKHRQSRDYRCNMKEEMLWRSRGFHTCSTHFFHYYAFHSIRFNTTSTTLTETSFAIYSSIFLFFLRTSMINILQTMHSCYV